VPFALVGWIIGIPVLIVLLLLFLIIKAIF
jgi:hypothetical protein